MTTERNFEKPTLENMSAIESRAHQLRSEAAFKMVVSFFDMLKTGISRIAHISVAAHKKPKHEVAGAFSR